MDDALSSNICGIRLISFSLYLPKKKKTKRVAEERNYRRNQKEANLSIALDIHFESRRLIAHFLKGSASFIIDMSGRRRHRGLSASCCIVVWLVLLAVASNVSCQVVAASSLQPRFVKINPFQHCSWSTNFVQLSGSSRDSPRPNTTYPNCRHLPVCFFPVARPAWLPSSATRSTRLKCTPAANVFFSYAE